MKEWFYWRRALREYYARNCARDYQEFHVLPSSPAIPDQFRLFLHRECDSPEQLTLRAHLLVQDSIYGNYFVRKKA